MAKRRIIPKLQLRESSILPDELVLVTTKKYKNFLEIGSPVSQAKIYEAQCIDELILLYLSPSKGKHDNKDLFLKTLRALSSEVFIPLGVGGGIEHIDDIKILLQNGADKVVINSIAHKSPEFVRKAANRFGSQCIVVSIDFRLTQTNEVQLYSNGGQVLEEVDPDQWINKMVSFGAGELIFNAIDCDGSMNGLPTDLLKSLTQEINVPIIISGGCGEAQHFVDGFNEVAIEAIAAGTFFCKQDQNPIQIRSQIQNAGIELRSYT